MDSAERQPEKQNASTGLEDLRFDLREDLSDSLSLDFDIPILGARSQENPSTVQSKDELSKGQEDAQTDSPTDRQTDSSNKSGLDFTSLMKGVSEQFAGNIAGKVVEQLPSWLPKVDLPELENDTGNLEPLEPEQTRIALVSHSTIDGLEKIFANRTLAGKSETSSNSDTSMSAEQLIPKSEAENAVPGRHENENGSSILVDNSGRIIEFQSAPSSLHRAGLTYKDIRYDKDGNIESYLAPGDFRFKRSGTPDDTGTATWQVNDRFGRLVPYEGARSHQWKGQALVNANGFHSIVENAPGGRAMFSKLSDGATAVLKAPARNSEGSSSQALSTTLSRADGTVASKSDSKHLTVKEAKSESSHTVLVDTASEKAYRVKEPAAENKSEEKKSELGERIRKQFEDGDDPLKTLNESLSKLENIKAAKVEHLDAGAYRVNVSADSAAWLPAIDIGRRLFTAGQTRLSEDFGFDFKANGSEIHISQMHGFRSSVTGPLGRSHPTFPHSMTIGRDRAGPYVDVTGHAQLRRRTIGNSMRLREHNLPAGSPMSAFMDNPEKLKEVASSLRLFQTNSRMENMSLNRVATGVFDVSMKVDDQARIDLDEPIADTGLKVEAIQIDNKLSARIRQGDTNPEVKQSVYAEKSSGNSIHLENIDGITVDVKSPFGTMKIIPRGITLEHGPDGTPQIELEIDTPKLPGTSLLKKPAKGDSSEPDTSTLKLRIPLSKLRN